MSHPRNAPCPCESGKKYKRCCGLPEPVGPPLNAADASAVLGLSYVTFRCALASSSSGIDTTFIPPQEQGGEGRPVRGRWQVPAREVRRLSEYFDLPLRELPAKGGRRPNRTSPARVLLSPRAAARVVTILEATDSDLVINADEVEDWVAATAAEAVRQLAVDFATWSADDAALVDLVGDVQAWRRRTSISACSEIHLCDDDRDLDESDWYVSPWELLHVEAVAVRLGIPAPHVLSVLFEQHLGTASNALRRPRSSQDVKVSVDRELLHAVETLTRRRGPEAVDAVLSDAIYRWLLVE